VPGPAPATRHGQDVVPMPVIRGHTKPAGTPVWVGLRVALRDGGGRGGQEGGWRIPLGRPGGRQTRGGAPCRWTEVGEGRHIPPTKDIEEGQRISPAGTGRGGAVVGGVGAAGSCRCRGALLATWLPAPSPLIGLVLALVGGRAVGDRTCVRLVGVNREGEDKD
jgi:hypothetical protein